MARFDPYLTHFEPFLTISGTVQDHFGTTLGPKQDQNRVIWTIFGSIRVTFGSLRDQFGIVLASFRGRFGPF